MMRSDPYRVSVLRKEVRERLMKGQTDRCSKVWEGEQCMLKSLHGDECVIAPPDRTTQAKNGESK